MTMNLSDQKRFSVGAMVGIFDYNYYDGSDGTDVGASVMMFLYTG